MSSPSSVAAADPRRTAPRFSNSASSAPLRQRVHGSTCQLPEARPSSATDATVQVDRPPRLGCSVTATRHAGQILDGRVSTICLRSIGESTGAAASAAIARITEPVKRRRISRRNEHDKSPRHPDGRQGFRLPCGFQGFVLKRDLAGSRNRQCCAASGQALPCGAVLRAKPDLNVDESPIWPSLSTRSEDSLHVCFSPYFRHKGNRARKRARLIGTRTVPLAASGPRRAVMAGRPICHAQRM